MGSAQNCCPTDDPRRGLIGSAVMLAMYSLPQRTSATKRGQFIVETLLCRTVPPPPPNVDTNLDDDPMDTGEHHTLRELLEPHRADPACAACHDLTDPLGLALEHYDTIGRWRDTDQGLTIDVSGELDGVPFADAAELAGLLREHPDAPSLPGPQARDLWRGAAAVRLRARRARGDRGRLRRRGQSLRSAAARARHPRGLPLREPGRHDRRRGGAAMRLARRTMLRGLVGGTAIALPLPRLAAMLDGNGTAYADGSAAASALPDVVLRQRHRSSDVGARRAGCRQRVGTEPVAHAAGRVQGRG